MKVLGITGGVGSGKSQVLAYLESEYQAVVCQMDEVAKQLQKKGDAVLPADSPAVRNRDCRAGR